MFRAHLTLLEGAGVLRVKDSNHVESSQRYAALRRNSYRRAMQLTTALQDFQR